MLSMRSQNNRAHKQWSYLEPCQTSKIKAFTKIIKRFKKPPS